MFLLLSLPNRFVTGKILPDPIAWLCTGRKPDLAIHLNIQQPHTNLALAMLRQRAEDPSAFCVPAEIAI